MESAPAHGRGVGTKWALGSIPNQNHSAILWFAKALGTCYVVSASFLPLPRLAVTLGHKFTWQWKLLSNTPAVNSPHQFFRGSLKKYKITFVLAEVQKADGRLDQVVPFMLFRISS